MVIRLTAVAIFAAAAVPSDAVADCTCRAKGVVAEQGEVVCLATPRGRRMARCDKVLNNSSWTFLDRACPLLGGITPVQPALAHLPQSALRDRGR